MTPKKNLHRFHKTLYHTVNRFLFQIRSREIWQRRILRRHRHWNVSATRNDDNEHTCAKYWQREKKSCVSGHFLHTVVGDGADLISGRRWLNSKGSSSRCLHDLSNPPLLTARAAKTSTFSRHQRFNYIPLNGRLITSLTVTVQAHGFTADIWNARKLCNPRSVLSKNVSTDRWQAVVQSDDGIHELIIINEY